MTWLSDSSQLVSGNWVSSAYAGHGITGTALRATTGTGSSGPGVLYNDWDAGDDAKEFRWLIELVPSGGQFKPNEDGSFSLTGAADGAYSAVYRLFVDGADLGTGMVSISIGP